MTYFAEVRQFETLVYLISTNIYYAEPKENDLIPDLDIKLTPGSGRRMTSHVVDCIAVKRIFWLYITVQVKCKYTLLLVFECVQDKRKRKKGCRNNTAWELLIIAGLQSRTIGFDYGGFTVACVK